MPTEVFLENVPGGDVSVVRCSLCKEEFHSSPVGPRKPMTEFHAHVRDEHPGAAYEPDPLRFFVKRLGKK